MERMGDRRDSNRVLMGKPEGRRPLGGGGGEFKIVIWILRKWNGEAWIGLICLRIGTGGLCL